jgi:hypothetical protein
MPTLTPILIRSFGRSGSTLLMQLLSSSPSVAIEDRYPYEDRYISYLYTLSRVIDKKIDATDGLHWSDGEVCSGKMNYVSGMPYIEGNIFDMQVLKDRLFMCAWNQFCESVVSKESLSGVVNFTHYAEKISMDLVEDTNRLIPEAKNIYLVRDPRAELLSIMQFNKKRGFHSFGWKKDDTPYSYAKSGYKSRAIFFRQALKRTEKVPNKFLLVRYEDLISNLSGESSRLEEWLNIKINSEIIETNKNNMLHHMTAMSAEASVDGWVSKLDDDVKKLYAERMGEELELMGYIN